ncbi:hypothetical protein [Thermococcus radiotolerans]|uniref:hypothetical protein n=1 Tax=Thermococcus radiotolerans TaxID=187880 RepID=UPI001E54D430|nr:hypothetical protein [Thermococcus radiotolerans]
MAKGGRSRISYETTFRAKVLILAVIFGIVIFMIVYYPLLSHQTNPWGVAAPKGQIILAQNFSINGVNYTNAVPFTSKNNALVLKGNDDAGETLTVSVSTPGWCVDLWVWGGSSKGWVRKYDCAREFQMSQYAFKRLPTHEAREILYWYLEPGYILVFHKDGEVNKYELVNFTVTYGGETDWGAFKVSIGKS